MAGMGGVAAPMSVDRVIAALSQGDRILAESIVVCMDDAEFASLRALARSLDAMTERESEARRRVSLLAKVNESMPACTCPPGATRHEAGCPRRDMLGASAPMRDGFLPGAGRADR